MLLIGMLDSPFVRRMAISMRLLGFAHEHGNWSVGRDFAQIRRYSPLGRVPALVLDEGTVLIESAAVIGCAASAPRRPTSRWPAATPFCASHCHWMQRRRSNMRGWRV